MHPPHLSILISRHLLPRARQRGNTLLIAVMFVAIFSIIVGASYLLSDETARRSARENRNTSVQVAADAALDVIYGRFSHWINAHTGRTPSIADATASITAPSSISFASATGLSDYTVTSMSLVPLMPDDTQGTDFPNESSWASNTSSYQTTVNKYLINVANYYEPTTYSNALSYLATVTVTPSIAGGQLHPYPVTVKRYFQKSEVSPFNYNIFTEGTFEDYDWGQSFDSEANIYASVKIQLDHPGTIINGSMRYGDSFVDPTGAVNGVNKLAFQDPTSGATVDPYTSGLLKQVSKIEVVPDITNIIAHDSTTGARSASNQFTSAADNFSRREIIEPPADPTNDTAPAQIQQRRIYTQADVRLKITTYANPAYTKTNGKPATLAKATFVKLDGSTQAQYVGTPSGTSTTWAATSGGSATTTAMLAAVNVNPVDSSAPFYDWERRYDSSSLGNGQAGQPTTSNSGHAIETVDVNVGVLTAVINGTSGTFTNNIIYIWDDGASGEKNGVRLYNGGILPSNGLTVGSTDPVYVKGDYNTGSVLSTTNGSKYVDANNSVASAVDLNAATTSVQPDGNTMGWANGTFATYDQRHVAGYIPAPAGIFGDTVTSLSQNWRDSSSATTTQYACSTTFNAVLGFGSGDVNSLRSDDTFADGTYSCVQTLEMWNSCRWNQLGEQMSLYHSIYNIHKNPPSWINGGWLVVQNDFDAKTAHVPLAWGYLVFSRGRYSRN